MATEQNQMGQVQPDVANKNYDPADYEASSEMSQALAATHEQVSDSYIVGTIDDRFTHNEES